MTRAEGCREERIRGSVFREPQLSSPTNNYEGEVGREFFIHGQRTLYIMSPDPEMGGSLYQLDDHRGRVGVVHTATPDEAYAYIVLADREEDTCIQEAIPATDALMLIYDKEVCAQFLEDHLRQMNLTFWDF